MKSTKAAALSVAVAHLLAGQPCLAQEAGEVATASAPVLINPATAMAYSAMLPGYGQIYAGEPVRGGVLLAIDAGLTGAAIAGYFLKSETLMQGAIVGMIFTTVVATFDAYLLVRDRNQERVEAARHLRGRPLPR
ncbi:MAG: hypothetical protein FJZ01_09600 [Candidatus Sericytochromatia bacterium]|nr:hypothetical protein [Candidatus Tanganyikabacteria bacterium]